MADSSAAEIVRTCCRTLVAAEADGEFNVALEACDQLLSLNADFIQGIPVHKCKLTALIQENKLDDALNWINRFGDEVLGDTTAARAYIYYRQQKNDEALRTLEEIDPNDLAALELKGQLLYRLERFKEAHEVYKKLCRDVEDDFEDLRRANILAVAAQLQQSGQTKIEPSTSDLDTYEQLYNQACHLVACERFDEASKVLSKATELCRTQLHEDGLTAAEVDDELAVFLTQKAFILQSTGQLAEALELYKQVQESKPSDSNVRKVLQANLAPFKNKYLLRRALKEQGKAIEHQEVVTGKLRRRKRKSKLPKNYDPNVQPDPERWLPKQERSTYKAKKTHKKFKDREVGRGTQGAAGNANIANIDYTTNAPKESPKPSPSPAQPSGPRQQRRKKR